MISKAVEAINVGDLESLVSAGVAEGRNLEFKLQLPGGSDGDIKEFLADITSFANAYGGDVIYGVREEESIASELPGLRLDDVDSSLLRLENILRDGIEPRLSGVKLHWVSFPDGGGALIVRIPSSFVAPHRVRFKNSGRFYSRNSKGKYEMDTQELRLAFTSSEGLPARLRDLHSEALAAAGGLNMPFALKAEPAAIVSVVPLSFFRERQDHELTPNNVVVHPHATSAADWIYTLEGLLIHAPVSDGRVRSFALTHRRGRVDAAWTIGQGRDSGNGMGALVWPEKFRVGLLEVTERTVKKLGVFGIEGPWAVLCTIIGVEGCKLLRNEYERSVPAWRNTGPLPEIITDTLDHASMDPILKSFWRLFGEVR